MKILLVSDHLDHGACHNTCIAIEKFIPHYKFDIVSGNETRISDLADKYDLIHFHYTARLDEYYEFIMKNSAKIIITIVNERSVLYGFRCDIKKFKTMVKKCAHAKTQSPRVAKMLKIPQIDNGIDLDLFNKFKTPVIGYAGHYHNFKNWKIIKEVCDDLGLVFKPVFRGKNQIPHEKMVDFYRGLDVYVLPSLTEAFNNTVIEALSCNVPVIMTKCGAWRKLSGFVEFIDPSYESLYRKLRKYSGRRFILKKFLWKDIIPKYKKIYDSIYNSLQQKRYSLP